MKNCLMKTVKRTLAFLLVLTLVLPSLTGFACVTVKAEKSRENEYGTPVVSGNCGMMGEDDGSVTWTVYDSGLDTDVTNGSYDTLVFSGNGEMMDNVTPPWPKEKITRLVIEEGVTSIGSNAFRYMNDLQTVDIAETVTGIGEYAFAYCSNLESISLPKNLTSIGLLSFQLCEKLKEITIPGTLNDFGKNAFCACSSLEKVTILYGVKELPADTFQGCSNLKVLVLPDSVTEISSGDDGGFNNCDSLESIVYPVGMTGTESAYLPKSTTQFTYEIDPNDDTKVILTIVSYGVDENGDIKDTVTIPDEVNGKKVKSITVDESLEEESITIKHDVHNFDNNPTCKTEEICTVCGESFLDSDNHKSKTLINAKSATCKETGYTGDTYCNDCQKTTEYGESIEKSETHTWDAGKVTKAATATDKGVKTYTCSVCKTTKTEDIPALGVTPGAGNSGKPGDDSGKQGNDNGKPVDGAGKNSGEDTNQPTPLKKGATIVDSASKGKYKVTLSDAKKGEVQFIKPTSKKSTKIKIPATIKKDGVTYKVTSIANNAFKSNTKIKEVTIGKNVKTIGNNVFAVCSKLNKVTIGSGVTKIGDKAFYKCTALKKVTIPSKVTKIGKSAFQSCKNLKTITIKTESLTTRNVGKNAFKGIHQKATIKVPKAKLEAYKSLLVKKGVSKTATIKK